jgi:ribosome modulation factor
MMVAEAYTNGYFSALDGLTREENPYADEVETEHRQSWDDGWEDAQDLFYVSER